MQFANLALVTGLLSVAQANDVIFYTRNTCSSGSYSGCYNIASRVCCSTSGQAAAVSVSKASSRDVATMWSGGGCSVQQCSAGAAGTYCCIWNGNTLLTGGSYSTSSAKKREDPQSAANCTGKVEVNVFGYASGANTAWEIHQEHVGESFSQLHQEFQTLSSDQKEAWLKAHGAVHSAQLHDTALKIGVASADV